MNVIKVGRAKLGISQTKLAERMNVSRTTVWNWENKLAIPKVSQIVDLSRYLDITLDDIMNFFNSKNKEE